MIWRREEGITEERKRERGNNSPRCKVQDLRFLPVPWTPHTGSGPVKHAFVLTWESYGNMFFSLFFWPRHWLGMLSWAGGGYSNILSDANDPLMMQREKIHEREREICSFFPVFKDNLLFFKPHLCYDSWESEIYSFSTWRGCWDCLVHKSISDHTERSLHHILLQLQFHESLTHKCLVTFEHKQLLLSSPF